VARYPYEQQAAIGPEDSRLSKAKPCPFCGSLSLSMSRLNNYVHCHKCGADGPEVESRDHDHRWRMAVDQWNLRTARDTAAEPKHE
jgi:transcription elongation factor Elf1